MEMAAREFDNRDPRTEIQDIKSNLKLDLSYIEMQFKWAINRLQKKERKSV